MAIYEVKVLKDVVLSQWYRIKSEVELTEDQVEELAWDGAGEPIGESKWESGSILDILETRKVKIGS